MNFPARQLTGEVSVIDGIINSLPRQMADSTYRCIDVFPLIQARKGVRSGSRQSERMGQFIPGSRWI